MINITGSFQHGVSSQTTTYQLIYGAGTPPVNAASVTGTSVGNAQTITALVGGQPNSFELPSIVTGLTLGTAYWFDLSVKESAGTTIPTQFTVTLQEF
jgi:type III secretory pathway component EscS